MTASAAPFRAGELVIAGLSSPREKFWGVLLALDAAGVRIAGIDLASFDDFVHSARQGEPLGLATVFFPAHRLERIELDVPSGGLPSLSDRFQRSTGYSALERIASAVLGAYEGDGARAANALGITEAELRQWMNAAPGRAAR